VQPDLMGLEISKGELRHLTGFDADDVFRPSILKDKDKIWGFLLNEMLVALALTPIIVGFLYAFIIMPTIGSSILLGILLLITIPILVLVFRWLWRRFTCPRSLTILLDEVDKYHQVVQAIDISDRLASSGNKNSNIDDREKIISALKLIREDLVRALQTEKILRDNKKLLANSQELFMNNLANLEALHLSEQAGEYGNLLNQSLQIAVDVQEEVRKLNSSG